MGWRNRCKYLFDHCSLCTTFYEKEMNYTLPLSLIGLSVACYSISQLQQQRKLKGQKGDASFWGEDSWRRKYTKSYVFLPPDNWYYRMFNIQLRERFPLSATFLVSLTDGYHLTQSLSFLTLSLGISLLANVNFFLIWISILFIHATVYRLLQR
jgi:hypothetical protein